METHLEKTDNSTDKIKKIIELALICGRHFQSSQTGYIHFYYQGHEADFHHPIPIYENILFALALLRSRTVEHIQEAKGIIERLLVFQHRDSAQFKGNFPIYLHDYPTCHDRLIGIQLIAPLYWILKSFGQVLGQELKNKIENSLRALIEYGRQTQEWKPLPYAAQVRLTAGIQACEALFEQKSESNLDLRFDEPIEAWNSTAVLSDILIAIQMIDPTLSQARWQSVKQHLRQTWHQPSTSYVGPCLKEWQKKYEPQPTLYDLWMGYLICPCAKRCKEFHPYQLQAALIQSCQDQPWELSYPFYTEQPISSGTWSLVQHPSLAYTFVTKNDSLTSSEKTLTPLRLVWGTVDRTHTLVCQGGNLAQVSFVKEKEHFEILFELNEEMNIEDREKQRELGFYMDLHPESKIEVEGSPGTVFEMGQRLTIRSGLLSFVFRFEILEGEGQFLGHLMKGNRPSQLENKGENRFMAYDWFFFLRTIRRTSRCKIKATLQLFSQDQLIL